MLLVIASLAIWLGILLSPWRPWSTRERIDATTDGASLADITILIPARNEAAVIGDTLAALARQDPDLRIIVIDDQSADGTADVARNSGLTRLTVIPGRHLPAGWSGKVWALEQALAEVKTPLIALLDADIEIDPGLLPAMRRKLEVNQCALVSVMVELRMQRFWERLLIPAFIFFFKLLYPFSLANGSNPRFAAAAGGCMLLRADALAAIGGFTALRDAMIDDCSLARHIKKSGRRIWIGLTRSARSLRGYDDLGSLWNMVARNAFTQLHHSLTLLVICTILLGIAFWMPIGGLLFESTRLLALLTVMLMLIIYTPILRYYGVSPMWAVALPVTGTLYLLMTWTSAWRYWLGERSRWKGRIYSSARSHK